MRSARASRAGLFGVLTVALTACAGAGSPDGPSLGSLSVDDVYRTTEQRLIRHGGVYHLTVRRSDDLGFAKYQGTVQMWVDATRDLAREEADLGEFGSFTQITTRDARYVRERDGRFTTTSGQLWRCRGVGVAASAILGCPGPTEESSTELRSGEYQGRPTILLETTGTTRGSDQNITFTRRLHLDPQTFLPLALQTDGEIDFGQIRPIRQRHVYSGAFINATAVQADFFDPRSIGHVATDPSNAFDRDVSMTVYWLGDRFSPGASLPDLVLAKVDAPSGGPGYGYLLHYAATDDRFGPPLLTLQLWPRVAWDSFVAQSHGANSWDDPCFTREELSLPDGGAAVLFSGINTGIARAPQPATAAPGTCPTGPPSDFRAHVFIEDVVVLVDAPSVFGVAGEKASPYNTREGVAAVIQGLRRR